MIKEVNCEVELRYCSFESNIEIRGTVITSNDGNAVFDGYIPGLVQSNDCFDLNKQITCKNRSMSMYGLMCTLYVLFVYES